MRRSALLFLLLLVAMPAPGIAQSDASPFPPRLPPALEITAAPAQERQAVELSDAYYTRLTIHRYGSYAILPLFAGQYYLGNKLIDGTSDSWVKPAHRATAYAIAGVFASNTVTGVWNAIESRHEKEGRGRRLLHSGLMLAADAGFAYTGLMLSKDASNLGDDAKKHRNAALVSVGLATSGALVMWLR
jgi:hypothetical protein